MNISKIITYITAKLKSSTSTNTTDIPRFEQLIESSDDIFKKKSGVFFFFGCRSRDKVRYTLIQLQRRLSTKELIHM